jgi:5-methylcytosine-specific restriction endonuclease McrA
MSKIIPLKKHKSYYIHSDGFIFREINHKKIQAHKKVNIRLQSITYYIEGEQYDLLNLMLEYFEIKYTPFDRISYKIIEERMPLSNISVVPFVKNKNLSKKDNEYISKFGCKQKANSANARDNCQITEIQVLTVLKFAEFRCNYCRVNLADTQWELDHYIPLSRGGKNVFENLVASCMICNRMKSNLLPDEFVKIVSKIYHNNKVETLKKELPKAQKVKANKINFNDMFFSQHSLIDPDA